MTTNFSKMTRAQIEEQLKAYQAELSRQDKESEGLEKIREIMLEYGISESTVITSLGGSTSTSAKKEDKKYSVQLDGKTYKTSSKQLTKAIKDTEEYQNLPEEQKVLDTFLRAYSTEYSQDYPFNANYDGNQFYMGMKGTMNAITKKYYASYLSDNALSESTDTKLSFKKLASEASQ
ncbi:hypothetical protein [Pantoea sp. ME81]|uniref:hypothetical protein n=1 Tax=Pantoea sp. ME81 TaxID=2743935 RepID=UPI0015F598E7|nr:hypothetical protein [Pantoea sp. ME81]